MPQIFENQYKKTPRNWEIEMLVAVINYFRPPYFFQNKIGLFFLPEASFGLRVLSLPASVRPSVTKENYGIAKKFNNTSQFIDDLATLNSDGYLQQFKERIYPKELVLNQENKEDNRATFLDLEAHIKDGKFYTKTFDKREAFNFEIVNYPDLSGNIPERPAYGIYITQVIRYAKICNQTKDFIDRIRLLFNKLCKKHFSKERLLAALKKLLKEEPLDYG